MKIDFVNHASLIVTAGEVRLISDPWLEGRVFHDGWALTASSVMRFDDFKDITHIWFRFEQDAARIADPTVTPRTQRAVVDTQTLVAAGARYRNKLLALAPPPLVRTYLAVQSYQDSAAFGAGRVDRLVNLAQFRVEPARLFVTDLNQAFTFDLSNGLQPSTLARDACDITLTSASLSYCFQFDWGGETLYVNGCFQENEGWKKVDSLAYPNRFLKYCNLLRRADLGYKLSWKRAAGAVFRKLSPV